MLYRFTNIFDLETVGPECIAGAISWDMRFILTAAGFFGVCATLLGVRSLLGCVGGTAETRKKRDPLRGKLLRAFLVIVAMGTVTLTTLSFQAYLSTDDGKFFLQQDIEYDGPTHTATVIMGSLLIAFVTVGVPFAIRRKTRALRAQNVLRSPSTRAAYGALYARQHVLLNTFCELGAHCCTAHTVTAWILIRAQVLFDSRTGRVYRQTRRLRSILALQAWGHRCLHDLLCDVTASADFFSNCFFYPVLHPAFEVETVRTTIERGENSWENVSNRRFL